MAKEERPGKVFIDWSQNDRAKTTVSVYSLRARPEPSVSTPLSWKEVESAVGAEGDVLRFAPGEVVERLKAQGDLFADVIELRQRLPDSVTQLLAARAP
jgi:bifunctional non-homologous end joining protein LigD